MQKMERYIESGSPEGVEEGAAIAEAIAGLTAIEHRVGWDRVERVAEIISKYFFGDDISAIHRHAGRRTSSLRKLASHPSCPFSKSQLHGLLAAHRVYHAEPAVRMSTYLTPSHVSASAPLDASTRSELLRLADERRLSVRELLVHVRDLRRRNGERRGRPPTTYGEKAITRYENGILCLQEGNALLDGRELAADARARLLEILQQARRLLDHGLELVREARRFTSSYPSGITSATNATSRQKAS